MLCNETTAVASLPSYIPYLVHRILEYASTVWDPNLIKDCDQIKKAQHAAARWVSSDYRWSTSVKTV